MKIHLVYTLIIIGLLGIAFATRSPPAFISTQSTDVQLLQARIEALQKENHDLKRAMQLQPKIRLEAGPETGSIDVGMASVPEGGPEGDMAGQRDLAEEAPKAGRSREPQRRPSFREQTEQLEEIEDLAHREKRIQQLAWNVRQDTLATVNWAMGLEDPDEQKLAMEAINRFALVGVGAMLGMDDTGVPKIINTLEEGALAATGLVAPGDRIMGMVDGDGSTIYFKGRPMDQVVALLRGRAGSQVRLLMERNPQEAEAKGGAYEVSVQRSMIIMQSRPEG